MVDVFFLKKNPASFTFKDLVAARHHPPRNERKDTLTHIDFFRVVDPTDSL